MLVDAVRPRLEEILGCVRAAYQHQTAVLRTNALVSFGPNGIVVCAPQHDRIAHRNPPPPTVGSPCLPSRPRGPCLVTSVSVIRPHIHRVWLCRAVVVPQCTGFHVRALFLTVSRHIFSSPFHFPGAAVPQAARQKDRRRFRTRGHCGPTRDLGITDRHAERSVPSGRAVRGRAVRGRVARRGGPASSPDPVPRASGNPEEGCRVLSEER